MSLSRKLRRLHVAKNGTLVKSIETKVKADLSAMWPDTGLDATTRAGIVDALRRQWNDKGEA